MSSLLEVEMKIVELCKLDYVLYIQYFMSIFKDQTENIPPPIIFVLSII